MNAIATPSVTPRTDWRALVRENWPDAVRLFAAALLAYLLARLLGLREVHWAVLTALITARGHAGGHARTRQRCCACLRTDCAECSRRKTGKARAWRRCASRSGTSCAS